MLFMPSCSQVKGSVSATWLQAEECRSSLQGFVIIGPPLHYWYLMLSRVNVQGLAGSVSEGSPLVQAHKSLITQLC